jgi:hypothetical protein
VAALVMVCSGVAQAQLPRGADGSGGSGGATAAPPATAVVPPAPVSEAAPAEAAPPPAPPSPEAAPASSDAEEVIEEEEPPRRKKSKKKRRHVEEDEQEDELDDAGEEDDVAPRARGGTEWKLRGPHFVLSAERLSSILSWSQTSKTTGTVTDPINGGSFSASSQSEESGTDVSLLGAGGFVDNPFSIPRVGFDYVFGSGFSIGGSLGYMVTSGKSEDTDSDGTSRTQDRPTVDILLFAPRLGMFIGATPKLGIWLRGGITRLAMSAERERDTIDGATIQTTQTLTLVDLTLDPQLVFSPLPHVGITVGPTLDIGLSGSVENSGPNVGSSTETELTTSSYGVTAGLIALF